MKIVEYCAGGHFESPFGPSQWYLRNDQPIFWIQHPLCVVKCHVRPNYNNLPCKVIIIGLCSLTIIKCFVNVVLMVIWQLAVISEKNKNNILTHCDKKKSLNILFFIFNDCYCKLFCHIQLFFVNIWIVKSTYQYFRTHWPIWFF